MNKVFIGLLIALILVALIVAFISYNNSTEVDVVETEDEITDEVVEDDVNKVVCTMEYNPVCGVDGVTYSNECVATRQNNVRVAHVGECGADNSQERSVDDRNSESDNLVIYSSSGFSPGELTVEVGETVTFINESSQGMWVATDLHPTHRNYSGTSLSEHCKDGESNTFDACRDIPSGESWIFTFDKPGEWSYHNHSSARDTGVIIVR